MRITYLPEVRGGREDDDFFIATHLGDEHLQLDRSMTLHTVHLECGIHSYAFPVLGTHYMQRGRV